MAPKFRNATRQCNQLVSTSSNIRQPAICSYHSHIDVISCYFQTAMFYEPVHDVQKPTHPRLHLRDMRDAHIIFEAVRRGLMKPVNRRLNEVERTRYITSGSVFVWEESEEETGLKRWTDGRIWSQSRMREVISVFTCGEWFSDH